jgi:hypothetical protein
MLSRNTVPHGPVGSSAPVHLPQLSNAHLDHHPTSPVLTLTLSQHHTERIPTPQDSARPLRIPRPLHLIHGSGQPRSHSHHLDHRLTFLHARPHPPARLTFLHARPHPPARLTFLHAHPHPPARLPQLTHVQLHLARHLSHHLHPRPH